MNFLDIQNLNKAFGGLRAVDDVSFSVHEHQIKAVIGPNGAGKTTLFNLIAGALEPDSGTIHLRGHAIQGQPPYRIAARGVARTFQNIKLFTHMTALENVMVGRHLRGGSGFISGMLSLPRTRHEDREFRERALAIMDMLGIADLAGHDAVSLAFGKQRIVEFARALASDPALILLDEPAAGLNIYETAEIARLITAIRDRGVTVLIIEHDMSLVMDISDEIVVLSSGARIAEGLPHDIQRNHDVISVYLGEDDAPNPQS